MIGLPLIYLEAIGARNIWESQLQTKYEIIIILKKEYWYGNVSTWRHLKVLILIRI